VENVVTLSTNRKKATNDKYYIVLCIHFTTTISMAMKSRLCFWWIAMVGCLTIAGMYTLIILLQPYEEIKYRHCAIPGFTSGPCMPERNTSYLHFFWEQSVWPIQHLISAILVSALYCTIPFYWFMRQRRGYMWPVVSLSAYICVVGCTLAIASSWETFEYLVDPLIPGEGIFGEWVGDSLVGDMIMAWVGPIIVCLFLGFGVLPKTAGIMWFIRSWQEKLAHAALFGCAIGTHWVSTITVIQPGGSAVPIGYLVNLPLYGCILLSWEAIDHRATTRYRKGRYADVDMYPNGSELELYYLILALGVFIVWACGISLMWYTYVTCAIAVIIYIPVAVAFQRLWDAPSDNWKSLWCK